MTNREKFAEEILDIVCDNIAVSNKTGKPQKCAETDCDECMFGKSCNKEAIKAWANAEYIERPKIFKKDRDFLEYIPDKYKYIARDKSGGLHIYKSMPLKVKGGFYDEKRESKYLDWARIVFPMVKWSDEKPWSIEDLKKLEVIEDYENN